MKMRPISMGLTRQFQIVEVEDQAQPTFRIEQAAVKKQLPGGKTLMQWVPIAITHAWDAAHVLMYRLQAEYKSKQASTG